MCLCWLQTIPTVCYLLINRLLAHSKHIGSCDLSHVGTCDVSGDLFLVWSCVIRSPDELARVPCFSGSCAGLIMGFTYGTFNLKLIKLDVTDCVHNSISSLGFCCTCNTRVFSLYFVVCLSRCLNWFKSSLAFVNSFSGSHEFSDAGYPFHLIRYCVLFLLRVGHAIRIASIS
jgi:hypothetical protein